MRTIRRFYFYLVAFISLEVVVWGAISLARTLFENLPGGNTNQLANMPAACAACFCTGRGWRPSSR